MERILLIEDDAQLGGQMNRQLTGAGFCVTWHDDVPPHTPEFLAAFDLVILDLMLPAGSGSEFLRLLREALDVPVLIVSAKGEAEDRVRGLKLGADDYLTKPFWPEELLERVRARLRRPSLTRGAVLQQGPLRLDWQQRQVFVHDEEVRLTRTEFDILAALARRPAAAVRREALVEAALDGERDADQRNALDVHVSRLRKKLGGRFVQTVWGIGYRLQLDDVVP